MMPTPSRPTSGRQQAAQLSQSFQRLHHANNTNEAKLDELRTKLRDARNDLSERDRQLAAAKRAISKLSQDRVDLQAEAEHDKALARKLESRLSVAHAADGKTQSNLPAKALHYKNKAAELRDALREAQAALLVEQQACEEQSRKAELLQAALDAHSSRARAPGAPTGSHTDLLLAVAQAQSEAASLAEQLAESHGLLATERQRADRAERHVEELQQAQVASSARHTELERQLSEAQQATDDARRDTQALQTSCANTAQLLDEARRSEAHLQSLLQAAEQRLAAALDRQRVLNERLSAAERSGRLSLEALRSEVSAAVERSESRSAEQRAGWAVREAELAEALLAARQAAQAATEQAAHREAAFMADRALMEARLSDAEQHVHEMLAQERQHLEERGRYQAQVEHLSEQCSGLRGDLAAARRQTAADASGATEGVLASRQLQAEVQVLKSHLEAVLSEQSSRERRRQAELAEARAELHAATVVKERLQAELLAARQVAGDAGTRHGEVDQHVAELHATVQSLVASKGRLQSTMLEQLSALRDRLQQAEDENQRLRSALPPSQRPAVQPAVHSSQVGTRTMTATEGATFPTSEHRPQHTSAQHTSAQHTTAQHTSAQHTTAQQQQQQPQDATAQQQPFQVHRAAPSVRSSFNGSRHSMDRPPPNGTQHQIQKLASPTDGYSSEGDDDARPKGRRYQAPDQHGPKHGAKKAPSPHLARLLQHPSFATGQLASKHNIARG